MKNLLLVLLTALAVGATAQPMGKMSMGGHGMMAGHHDDSSYVGAETRAIEAEMADRTLGDLKFPELRELADRLQTAGQKDLYVVHSAAMSFVIPGSSQFHTGNAGVGALQLGLSAAISGGTMWWAHSLLPADLQWGTLDYANSSFAALDTAWKSHTLSEFAPALGALVAGQTANLVVRLWSGISAKQQAKDALDSGKVELPARRW